MTCLGCGRTLKSEKSIQIGYGPVCYRKMFLGKRRLPWMEIGEITLWQMIKNYSLPGQYSLSDYIDM